MGYGSQPLYNISASVGTASAMHRRVGFRTSRLQTDQGLAKEGQSNGSGNSSMVLLVNGERILCRGSSLVPLVRAPLALTERPCTSWCRHERGVKVRCDGRTLSMDGRPRLRRAGCCCRCCMAG